MWAGPAAQRQGDHNLTALGIVLRGPQSVVDELRDGVRQRRSPLHNNSNPPL